MELHHATLNRNKLDVTPALDGQYVVAIGNFDGVHLGHQEIVSLCIQTAKYKSCKSLILTFDPHPGQVVNDAAPPYITSCAEKIAILEQLDVDSALVLNFDATLAALSPKQFVELLASSLNIHHIITGIDFRFGCKRSGNTEELQKHALQHGISTQAVRRLSINYHAVSSSLIRETLAYGGLQTVRTLLGRRYTLEGKVEPGRGIAGPQLNTATANITLCAQQALPCWGVYFGNVSYPGHPASWALINIGLRPTVDKTSSISSPKSPIMEVHLLNKTVNLYNQYLTVEPLHFIRPERLFPNLEALKYQIAADLKIANTLITQDTNVGR